ncbi:MAG: hypothetical protein V4726_17515 [Verrucomicrobiota bacterium]
MKLSGDLQNVRLLHLKGWLFLLIAVLCALLIFAENPHLKTVLLTVLLAWSASRFYYYLFYVLEKYAGRDRPYAGILDEITRIRARRK